MPQLSIIVPLFHDAPRWEETLISILQHRPDDCEIIVPHAGSYDDPYDLAAEIHLLPVLPDATFVTAINAAMEVSQGEVLHTLLPGVTVADNWCQAALRHFDDSAVAAVSPMTVSAENEQRVVSVGVQYKSGGARKLAGARRRRSQAAKKRWSLVGPALNAAFYRKASLESIGGLSPRVGDALADVDAGMSWRAMGLECRFEPESVVTSDIEVKRERTFNSGRNAERLFWRHAPAAGWMKSLLLHPFAVSSELACSLPRGAGLSQLLGRVCGSLELAPHVRHWRQVRRSFGSPSSGSNGVRSLPEPASHLRVNAAVRANVRGTLTESVV